MNNEEKHGLCFALMCADSESEVVAILTAAGLWDNKRVWRLYGDRKNNFSTIGNQQNRPDAALVEKLVNSVDARLMHECMARGITPESPAAPKDIRDAFEAELRKAVAGGRADRVERGGHSAGAIGATGCAQLSRCKPSGAEFHGKRQATSFRPD